ncbi:hypothetical protein NZJ93_04190 [Desulfofundulus thermocisternus]|nr:hypothetical protein [Desulfofundulus thermocisternus]
MLLIQPRPRGGLGYKSLIAVEPLGPEIVGAALKDHSVRLLDMLAGENITAAVQDFRPEAVGINCSFTVEVNKQNSVKNNEKALGILDALGINVYASFIVDPDFSPVDFQKSFHYVRKLKIRQPQFTILTLLPGTELFERFKNKLTTTNYEFFDLLHAVVPTRLPLPQFYREFTTLYRRVYLRPGYYFFGTLKWLLLKLVTGRLSLEHLQKLVHGAKIMGGCQAYLENQMARV